MYNYIILNNPTSIEVFSKGVIYVENSNLMDVVLNSGYLDILFYPLNMLIDLDIHYEVNESINPIRH